MRLLLFLVLSGYGLVCKYGIISNINIQFDTEFNFLIFLVLHVHIFKIKLQI